MGIFFWVVCVCLLTWHEPNTTSEIDMSLCLTTYDSSRAATIDSDSFLLLACFLRLVSQFTSFVTAEQRRKFSERLTEIQN
jgi:hypothetical protein